MSRETTTARPERFFSRYQQARLATFFAFFQMGAMMLIWSTSTSPLRDHLGWGDASGDRSFGLLALAIGTGGAVGCFVIGPILDRIGPRNALMPALAVYPLAYIPLAYIEGLGAAMVAGALIGLLRGGLDTASNAHGVQVERHYERPLMSAFHAAYSGGGFVLGIVMSLFVRHLTDDPRITLVSFGMFMSVLGLLAGRWLLGAHELRPVQPLALTPTDVSSNSEARAGSKEPATVRGVVVLIVMVSFGVLLLGSMLSENAVIDWGQEFVRRHAGTTATFAGLAVTTYSGAQFVGRLFGDRIADRVGSTVVMSASGVLGSAGALIAMLGPYGVFSLVGFGMLGLGLACMAPLMLSSAGRYDPANAGRNIGLVNALGYMGMLVGPAAITVVVDGLGISLVPLLPAILLALVAFGGPLLMRRTAERGKTSTGVSPQPAWIAR